MSELNGKRSKIGERLAGFLLFASGKVRFGSLAHQTKKKNKHIKTKQNRNQIEFKPYNFIDIDICCLSKCIFFASLSIFTCTFIDHLKYHRGMYYTKRKDCDTSFFSLFFFVFIGKLGRPATNYDHMRIFVQVNGKWFYSRMAKLQTHSHLCRL